MTASLATSDGAPGPEWIEAGPLGIALSGEGGDWPEVAVISALAKTAVEAVLAETGTRASPDTELSLVFADDALVAGLNKQWRNKDGPTNVLSFPVVQIAPGDDLPPVLGDIVLAAETVSREAALEGRPIEHHISHLLVHGLLHLMGFDHQTDEQAEVMEAIERAALARLAIPDPYA